MLGSSSVPIDLRTAQNRVHDVLVDASEEWRLGGEELDRIDEMHSAVRSTVLESFAGDGSLGRIGFSLFADAEAQSRTSFVVRVPEHLDASGLIRHLEEKNGVAVSPALHPEANTKNHNLMRFGVYSASTVADVGALLESLEAIA